MAVLTVIVPAISVLVLAAAVGLVFDLSRGRGQRTALLGADEARARATLDYYNRVHDSMSG